MAEATTVQVTRTDDRFGPLTFDVAVAGPEDGDLVVLLHGFPQTGLAYRGVVGPLADAGYRVLVPDQRGYSPGARPSATEAYATELLVDDVLALVDWAGEERFHLVGHDWGAVVAWRTAVDHAARLRTLTALSVPHPRAFADAVFGDRADGDQAGRSSYVAIFREEGTEHGMLANEATGLRMLYAASGLTTEESAPYLAALSTPEALGAALRWYRAGDLTMVELGDVEVPTLYVWSTGDVALGRAGAEATERYVSGPYRFVVLDGVDHWIPEHATDRLVDELLAWYAAHP